MADLACPKIAQVVMEFERLSPCLSSLWSICFGLLQEERQLEHLPTFSWITVSCFSAHQSFEDQLTDGLYDIFRCHEEIALSLEHQGPV